MFNKHFLLPHCLLCSKINNKKGIICFDCNNKKDKDKFDNFMQRCPLCFKPILSNEYLCSCIGKKEKNKVFSIYDYNAPFMRRILERWKFNGERELTPFIAEQYYEVLKNLKLTREMVVLQSVPCSKDGKKKRKFDQMKEIAFYLKKKYKYDNCSFLKLSHHNLTQQKMLNKKQREENTNLKFCYNESANKTDKKIVLLDDITTTGSTLNVCKKIIENHAMYVELSITLLAEL